MSGTVTSATPPPRIGVIEGPGWYDPTGDELQRSHAVAVEREPLAWDGFDWSLEHMAQSLPYIQRATQRLVARGCSVVVQAGPAFGYVLGGSLPQARALQDRIGTEAGCHFVFNGVAVLEALDALPTRTIAVACPYYDSTWEHWLTAFLQSQGYTLTRFTTFCSSGIFSDQASVVARAYAFTPEEVQRCVQAALDQAGAASGLLISGSGVRTLPWLGAFAQTATLPLISADGALYQAAMRAAGLPSPI